MFTNKKGYPMCYFLFQTFICMDFRFENTSLTTPVLLQFFHAMRWFWRVAGRSRWRKVWMKDVRDVGCLWLRCSGYLRCGMFEMWDVQDVLCSRCRMFGLWDVPDVVCSGCRMFGLWDVPDVVCSGCGMLRMWDIWGLGWWGMWDFRMCDVQDVGYLRYGMLGIWDVWDVRCSVSRILGIWDVWDVGCLLGCGTLIYKMLFYYF